MGKEAAGEQATTHTERCACRDVAEHLAVLFGVRSEGAREHLRNARIEMLKAVRSIIDDRIEYLSKAGVKGTKVTVE